MIKKIKMSETGSVRIGPYKFSLILVDDSEKISVVFPGEYGMEHIVFPSTNYCEDWIRSTDIIWICDCCGKIIDTKGIIEDAIEGQSMMEYCEDCFKQHMDSTYGTGNWEEAYNTGAEIYYKDKVEHRDCEEFIMTSDANWEQPGWFKRLITK